MNFTVFGIAIAAGLILFAIIHRFGKNKRPVRRAFLSMLSGIVSLAAVNIAGLFTGVYLPISLLTLTVSLLGGLPGVTMLLALNLFF